MTLPARAASIVRVARALLALVVSLAFVASVALLDGYLGRGGEWGVITGRLRPTQPLLGANTFLHFEVDRHKVDQTADMLQAAGIGIVRQQFAWNEIEPRPGVFVDASTGQSTWAKYDYLVEALAQRGIKVLARVENTPTWARPGEDTAAAPFGPPADYDRYAAFVAQVVERYQGKVTAVQLWNEPNVRREWGERSPDPAAYMDLARRAAAAARAVDPTITIISAGLAPTDGFDPSAVNDILFLEGMYAAGARGVFDAVGVMVYGLGQSPDDRRLGLRHPINFSRPILTREVMVRHGDAATPVWATEFGWVSVPSDWTGRPSTWGGSVDEELQAAYLLRGLERARSEWPWMGAICIWAFRFVETTMDPADPQRHFAIVRNDFSPRPAYTALVSRAAPTAAPPGVYAVTDPTWRFAGAWQTQTLAGRVYRIADTADARAQLSFAGDRVALIVRRSVDGGRLYVRIDGAPVPSLPQAAAGSYLPLGDTRTSDAEVVVARGLSPGPHTLELTTGGTGEVALAGLVVSRDRPLGWAIVWLHGTAVLALTLAGWQLLRLALRWSGYLPSLPARPETRRAWR